MPPPKSLQRFYARSAFYPTLWWNMLHGRVLKTRNWSTRIDPHLIVGAYPFARDVSRMFADGVRAVVNTCEEYPGPVEAYQRAGIEQLHIPTTDFTHPLLEDIELAVEFIQVHAQRDETTYVHCKAGRARSVTVALCWMVKYRGMSAAEAQQELLKLRSHVNPRVAERAVVQAFVEKLNS